MIVGIVGLNGSGKDTFAEYVIKKYGFAHKDLGQEIRDELKKLKRNHLDRNEMVILGNERRVEFGFDYWAKKAIESTTGNLIITSVRNPKEVQKIVSSGGVLIEIVANQKTRYDRTVSRVKKNSNTHGDVKSFSDFKVNELKELKNRDPSKQQLSKCIKMAKYHVTNNSSIEDLHKKIDKLFKKLLV
jgi:dephospho-CoA kinase